jgi:hypothetical protein
LRGIVLASDEQGGGAGKDDQCMKACGHWWDSFRRRDKQNPEPRHATRTLTIFCN